MTSGQVILQDSVHFLGLAAPLPMPPDYRSSIQILYVRHDTKHLVHSPSQLRQVQFLHPLVLPLQVLNQLGNAQLARVLKLQRQSAFLNRFLQIE